MGRPKGWTVRISTAALLILGFAPTTTAPLNAASDSLAKLDSLLLSRRVLVGRSRIVVRTTASGPVGQVVSQVQQLGGQLVRRLPLIDSLAIDLLNAAIPLIAANPLVERLSMDRVVAGAMERTAATIGAAAVRQELGYDGAGVGVAIIDWGVAPSHDDLADAVDGTQRVDRFVDFVNGREAAYDDYGHGTHVGGIVAGNGFDSGGARSGIAPGAHLIVLKVLDAQGRGRISDVIAALDYTVANRDALNIRIVNLSVASGVYESYDTDPLTLAAKRAVSAGLVVVAAAGNLGRGLDGSARYAGITAPGNAPWVLTVGASSHMGTTDRADDTIAPFSSRGPGAIDHAAKPDIVAPGVGLESLSAPASTMYITGAPYLLSGTVSTGYLPYLSQSGTSMAAPVVTGTVALMLQANPALTPNAVKAILQYTAQTYAGYDVLTQGAGFVNAKGAVELAAYFGAPGYVLEPDSAGWGRRIVWGNRLETGGALTRDANAWSADVTWGATTTAGGQVVVLGVKDAEPWRAGTPSSSRNVVWGQLCGGGDCDALWDARTLAGASEGEGDTVVWGTGESEGDTVVWGTTDAEGDTVVWGTACTDPSCLPVVWSR